MPQIYKYIIENSAFTIYHMHQFFSLPYQQSPTTSPNIYYDNTLNSEPTPKSNCSSNDLSFSFNEYNPVRQLLLNEQTCGSLKQIFNRQPSKSRIIKNPALQKTMDFILSRSQQSCKGVMNIANSLITKFMKREPQKQQQPEKEIKKSVKIRIDQELLDNLLLQTVKNCQPRKKTQQSSFNREVQEEIVLCQEEQIFHKRPRDQRISLPFLEMFFQQQNPHKKTKLLTEEQEQNENDYCQKLKETEILQKTKIRLLKKKSQRVKRINHPFVGDLSLNDKVKNLRKIIKKRKNKIERNPINTCNTIEEFKPVRKTQEKLYNADDILTTLKKTYKKKPKPQPQTPIFRENIDKKNQSQQDKAISSNLLEGQSGLSIQVGKPIFQAENFGKLRQSKQTQQVNEQDKKLTPVVQSGFGNSSGGIFGSKPFSGFGGGAFGSSFFNKASQTPKQQEITKLDEDKKQEIKLQSQQKSQPILNISPAVTPEDKINNTPEVQPEKQIQQIKCQKIENQSKADTLKKEPQSKENSENKKAEEPKEEAKKQKKIDIVNPFQTKTPSVGLNFASILNTGLNFPPKSDKLEQPKKESNLSSIFSTPTKNLIDKPLEQPANPIRQSAPALIKKQSLPIINDINDSSMCDESQQSENYGNSYVASSPHDSFHQSNLNQSSFQSGFLNNQNVSQPAPTSFLSNLSHFMPMGPQEINRAINLFSAPSPQQNNSTSLFGIDMNQNNNSRSSQDNRSKKSKKSKQQRVYN